jgi:hypothetical protein
MSGGFWGKIGCVYIQWLARCRRDIFLVILDPSFVPINASLHPKSTALFE